MLTTIAISRKIATPIVKILAKTKITPNQVTIGRGVILIPLFVFFFIRGDFVSNLIGLFLYVVFFIFDHVDGQLARSKSMESELGAFIEDLVDRAAIIIALTSIAFGSSRRSGNLLPFFLVFFLLLLDSFQELIAFKRHEFGIQIGQDEMRKLRREFRKKMVPWRQRLFFNLIYLEESPLLFVFAKVYPFILGILFDQVLIAFLYMLVSGFIYLIATVYVCVDFTRNRPSLLVVRLIKKINQL